ncbi:mechanosensitive ion channel family protein [Bordetella genomosp. 11]|uniref:Mechanosensitive ion channel protein MscS n=1 Tax=Bordetella genomosp. 11 TaxID=1416808 RepID=A0A261UZH2_9BORD|nr:mechanosensitive ion channel family protein [Bordetella genomosp. 11]OZI66967.1 mechanosensitive ion channel protein MscS [Bordetella genomosp. 11]
MSDNVIGTFFTDTRFLGIPLLNWLIAVAAACVTFAVARIAIGFLRRRLQARSHTASAHFSATAGEVIAGTSNTLVALASLLVGAGLLDLPARWAQRIDGLWFVVAILQIALWAHRAMMLGMHHYFRRHAASDSGQLTALAALSLWGAKVLLWAVVLLAMLSNLGVNITAFVASLGVGGIAVALAVQNILGDLFASMSIAIDKPFEVNDFIVVGTLAGTVEHVGLKTTRIRSLGGEQIVMSNASMLTATIQNYKRLRERRVVFQFGLDYACTVEQVRQVPQIVERIIRAQDKTRFDRSHFKGFGESSLDFETVYIVLDPGYNPYMDIQQAINLGMMEAFAEIGVRFAHPVRMLHVESLPQPGRREERGRRPEADGGAMPMALSGQGGRES